MNNNELNLLIKSDLPLIVVQTFDESRALEVLDGMFAFQKLLAYKWTVTDGLLQMGAKLDLLPLDHQKKDKPEEVLQHIKASAEKSAHVLCDFHHYLDEPKVIRYIKDIAQVAGKKGSKLIFLSHEITLPEEISRYAASVSLSLPDENEILSIIRDEARVWAERNQAYKVKTDNETLKKLVNNLIGLSHQDVKRLAHGAISDDGAITESDLPEITKAKFELMNMDSVLHYEYSTAHLKDVGGLHTLKRWLEDRKSIVLNEQESHIQDAPKGVLLFGVQGGGKSLAAKSIAGVWGLPLLQLDMAALFNKYIGETEKNLREALKLADLMTPCVLWIDEIEKGMANDGADNATGKRLLGTLLTWMSERTSRVFMVGTSNDISVLPPELMRKGRFDEIFFVDLPDQKTRETIFKIHLTKRDLDVSQFQLDRLAEYSEGFTGAEIEQAVVSAIYSANARARKASQAYVFRAIQQTQPLSIVMAEQIHKLRTWAKERAVSAN